MLQIAICDDEAPQRLRLREWLTRYYTAQNVSCVFTEYGSGEELYAAYQEQTGRFDLVFLDIYMGGMNGIETAAALRGQDPLVSIVFLTTSPDHAIDGYTVSADGYLLKPAGEEQLTALMERLRQTLRHREENSLLVGSESRCVRIPFDRICWLESRNKAVELHLLDGTVHVVYEKLCDMESRLNAPCFLKCNRGVIVNMEYVTDAIEDFVMRDGMTVPIKVRDRKAIREQYYAYLMTTRTGGKSGEVKT